MAHVTTQEWAALTKMPRARICMGSPALRGSVNCRAPATCVVTDTTGLRWYACDVHTDGHPVIPIAEWWVLVDERIAANDTIARLEGVDL